MTLRFKDGFDHWASKTEMNQIYTWGNTPSSNLDSSTPYSYGLCVRVQDGAGQGAVVKSPFITIVGDTIFVGFNFRPGFGGSDNTVRMNLYSSSDTIVATWNVKADGTVRWILGTGGTEVAASATGQVVDATWNWIEMKIVCKTDTTGSVEFRLNGTEIANVTGIQTINSSAGDVSSIALRFENSSGGNTFRVDDLFVWDTDGTDFVDFLGPSRIFTLKPTANGAEDDWLPTPDNYQNIDENFSDDDTTYIYSDTGGNRATYDIEALPYDPAMIHSVQVVWRSRKTDAATRKAKIGIISGVTEDMAAEYTQAASYVTRFEDIHELNPDTSLEWDRTAVEALQIVIEDTTA